MSRGQRSAVLAVRSDSFAGVERYLCDVANELVLRDWQVAVIGGDPTAMRERLRPTVRWSPAATTLLVAAALARQGHVDVVHVHMTAAEAAAVLALPFTRRRFVTTRHFAGTRGLSRAGRGVAPLVRVATRRQVSISEFVADSLGEASVVIYNGVHDQPQAALLAPHVTMLQRLEPEKDPMTGLRAWAAAGLGQRGWRLRLAGRGALGPMLLAEARRLGVQDTVDLLGFVDDTAALLSDTSVVLATATAEPFGLSVVEAMARGVPVVASNAGAHRETIDRTDLLFPVGDHAAAAVLLRGLADDLSRRHAVGGRLRDRQQALFSVVGHVDRLEQVYLSRSGVAP